MDSIHCTHIESTGNPSSFSNPDSSIHYTVNKCTILKTCWNQLNGNLSLITTFNHFYLFSISLLLISFTIHASLD